jgi:DNA-directed RNA polymerase specialized sigma24 family protein
MTDQHQKFQAMLVELGLTYRSLGDMLGISYNSVKSMCAPGDQSPKKLPKWAVSMLIVWDRMKGEDG